MRVAALFLTLLGGMGSILPDVPLEPVGTIEDYKYKNKFDYIYVEPVKSVDLITKIIVKVSFAKSTSYSGAVTIKIKNTNSPEPYLLKTFLISKQKHTFTYDCPQGMISTNYPTNEFIFELTSPFGNDSIWINAKNYEYQNVRITNESQTISTASNIGLYTYVKGTTYVNEALTFSNCQQEYLVEDYNPLNSIPFSIKYTANKSSYFYCSNPRLIIISDNTLFKNVGTTLIEGYAQMLELEQVTSQRIDHISFKLKNKLYVDPRTFEMSSAPKTNYIETSKFYFPAYLKEGVNFTFKYVFSDVCANDIDISYDLNVKICNRLSGNCLDNQYCISTREATPDIDVGTRISY